MHIIIQYKNSCVTLTALQTLLVDDGGVSQGVLGHGRVPHGLHGLDRQRVHGYLRTNEEVTFLQNKTHAKPF